MVVCVGVGGYRFGVGFACMGVPFWYWTWALAGSDVVGVTRISRGWGLSSLSLQPTAPVKVSVAADKTSRAHIHIVFINC